MVALYRGASLLSVTICKPWGLELKVQGRMDGMQGTSSVIMDASTRDRRSGRQMSG